jgi:TorA maturation chaperone TorD
MKREKANLLKGYNMLLYFGGSMIMSEPTDECVIDFWANGSLSRLPLSSTNPRFIKAASLLRDSCNDKITCRNLLHQEFSRLLDENGSPLAPARASAYINGNRNEADIVTEISDVYSSYGWEPRQTEIPPDHLGIELLFLTKLIDKYMVLDDEPCIAEMKNEITRFIDMHILAWIAEWDEKVRTFANSDSFRGISSLIYACIEDIRGIINSSDYTAN